MSGLRTVHDLDLDRVDAARDDDDAISWLQTGDILVARRESSWASRVIGALDGYWSHAALYVGNGELVETGINGATITPAAIFRSRYPAGVGAIRPALPSEDGAGAAAWARRLANGIGRGRFAGYDHGLAHLMLRRARGRQALAALAAVNDAGLDATIAPFRSTCAGLVYQSYRYGSGVALDIRVAPGLELVDGVLRLGPEAEIADLIAPGAGPDGPLDGAGLTRWIHPLGALRRAAGPVAGDVGDTGSLSTMPVEDGVTPGDLWMIHRPARRWLFTPADQARASRLIDRIDDTAAIMVHPPRSASATGHHSDAATFLLDDLPDEVTVSLDARDEWRTEKAARNAGLAFIARDVDRWPTTVPVSVAFLDGPTSLHHRIAEVAGTISDACGLTLDFGYNPDTVGYRTWSETDTTHTADIRIGFDQPGHWSLVGTAAIDRSVGPATGPAGGRPGQRSLNLHGFDRHLPAGWRGTVLRTFLRAVAFRHEHQNLRGPCRTGFRWEDDPGYRRTSDGRGGFVADPSGRRPGIYTYLSGAPNHWDRAKVDRRIRSVAANGPPVRPIDPASVMLYRFPELFYRRWPSSCAPTGDGQSLSDGDRQGLDLLYPTGTVPNHYPLAIALASAALYGPDGGETGPKGPTSSIGTGGGATAHAEGMYTLLRELGRRFARIDRGP
ncbi:MAG: hypothetical protein ACK5PP_03770 [Acidimicrobiales bacterium]